MQRMTNLLFGENGVYHNDLDGRMNSEGSKKVYQNRGGVLPRKRPAPEVTALYDGQVIESDDWKITVRKVYHQPDQIEPYAFRIETDEGVLVYSGDTGPCEGIAVFARDADLMIHMCYFISGTFAKAKTPTSSGHMECARIAAEGNVRTLVATHFTPQLDAHGVKERCIAQMSEVYKGRIIWGEDLMEIPLHPEPVPHAG